MQIIEGASLRFTVVLPQIIKGGHYIVACTSTHDHGQDLDPSNFCSWPLDHTEYLALTVDYPALTTPIDCLESLWLFLSCLDSYLDRLTSSKLKFRLDSNFLLLASGHQATRLEVYQVLLKGIERWCREIARFANFYRVTWLCRASAVYISSVSNPSSLSIIYGTTNYFVSYYQSY